VLEEPGGGGTSKSLLDGAELERARPERRPATGGVRDGSAVEVLRDSGVADAPKDK